MFVALCKTVYTLPMVNDSSEKLVLVPYVRGYRLRQVSVLLIFSILSLALGYVIAHKMMRQGLEELSKENKVLQQNLENFAGETKALTRQLTILQRGRDIDEQAKRSIGDTINGLEAQVAQLKQDVTFYKNIMAPTGQEKGLSVQKLEFSPSASDGKFSYKFVLAQVANNKNYIEGIVAINFIGTRQGEREIFALKEISDVADLGIKFRFRYFQNFEGSLALPEGFAPEKVQIVAQSKGKRSARIEETFVWTGKGEVSYVEQKG